MENVVYRGCTIEIPSHVSELTQPQYEYLIFLAMALSSGCIDDDCFKRRWMSHLIGLSVPDYLLLHEEYISELDSQLGLLDGFFTKRPGVEGWLIDFSTPFNLLPAYHGYTGPGDWLSGVKYGEFVECLTVIEGLCSLDAEGIAQGYEHIARVLYHIPVDEKVPDILAFHAPTLFISVWHEIQNNPVEINGIKLDLSIIFKSSGHDRPDDKTGWAGITFEVVAAGLFGTVPQVEATDFWEVLLYLYRSKVEYEYERRKYK